MCADYGYEDTGGYKQKTPLLDDADTLTVQFSANGDLCHWDSAELKLMFSEINDEFFNAFVRFAYYTGARSGEIRRIAKENVLEGSLLWS